MPEKDYKSSEEFRELSDRVQEPQGKAPISPSKDRSLPRRNFLKVLGGISLVGILGAESMLLEVIVLHIWC